METADVDRIIKAIEALTEQTRRIADAHRLTWHYITSRDGANAQRRMNASLDVLKEMAKGLDDD